MKQFAKTFDTEHGQVLVSIDLGENDAGDSGPVVSVRLGETDGMFPEIQYGPWEDNEANWQHVETILAEFDQDKAESHARQLYNVCTGFRPKTEQGGQWVRDPDIDLDDGIDWEGTD